MLCSEILAFFVLLLCSLQCVVSLPSFVTESATANARTEDILPVREMEGGWVFGLRPAMKSASAIDSKVQKASEVLQRQEQEVEFDAFGDILAAVDGSGSGEISFENGVESSPEKTIEEDFGNGIEMEESSSKEEALGEAEVDEDSDEWDTQAETEVISNERQMFAPFRTSKLETNVDTGYDEDMIQGYRLRSPVGFYWPGEVQLTGTYGTKARRHNDLLTFLRSRPARSVFP